jgi:DNA-binding MarR family transcriptional regulator
MKGAIALEHIGKYVSIIYRVTQADIRRRLEELHIGSGQYIYLLNLYTEEGVTADDLTRTLHADKATTARALKKLEDNGYISRITSSHDRRSMTIHLTGLGLSVKERLKSILNAYNEEMTAGLSDAEVLELIRLLRKLSSNIT